MEKNMFCFQCEQTAGCSGCAGAAGVCGKKADTANNGDIVVALVDESEATLKEIKKEN